MQYAIISTSTIDYTMPIKLPLSPKTDWGPHGRRIQREATLDGGCSITDHGFSDADLKFGLVIYANAVLANKIQKLIREPLAKLFERFFLNLVHTQNMPY
ncbi:MAG: hypothetical protein HQK58_10315 [Deltaproteobacteria bacterium]|nr:hypothetical protein [Deltaproteobacteria bacterium]